MENIQRDEFDPETDLKRLVQTVKPDRVVIEVCSIAGWVCDLMGQLGIEVQVANTSDDAWRWRKVKQKDDRLLVRGARIEMTRNS